MGTNSKIDWCAHTLNFWRGCTKISPGCDNCYMFREQKRYGLHPEKVVRTSEAIWRQPFVKTRDGELKWKPGDTVFVNSWSDWCHEGADEWRMDAWHVIAQRPDLNWLILTKRIERLANCVVHGCQQVYLNLWLGVTICNQQEAHKNIPLLRSTPAVHRFISAEPMLEEVNLGGLGMGPGGVRWVICGAETGPNARPMELDWARSLRDQCQAASVPFFVKQLHINGKVSKNVDEWPEDLRVRRFPAVLRRDGQ